MSFLESTSQKIFFTSLIAMIIISVLQWFFGPFIIGFIVGAAGVFFALCGLWGAWRKSTKCLWIYMVGVAAFIVLEIVSLIFDALQVSNDSSKVVPILIAALTILIYTCGLFYAWRIRAQLTYAII